MEDLDFTRPAKSSIYDPAVARKCFEALGKAELMQKGGKFFVEDQKSDRMYLLVEGEVGLNRGGRSIDVVKSGEIFGELAAISQQPRSATAAARTACRALSLDAKQFQAAIQKTPEFALMLMNIMVSRLRVTIARLTVTRSLPDWAGRDSRVFDEKLLGNLAGALPDRPALHFPAHKVIMKAGEGGVFMYVVLKGRVAITIETTTVERIGPGGIFGEMALVDQFPRAASAEAETDSTLLAINRNDFLALVKSKPEFGVTMLRAVADRLRYMTASQK